MRPADVVLSIARKEFADRLRNRWTWTVSALLVAAALAIAFFGAAPVGVVGVQRAGAATASMMNLTLYIVPLLALILGCGAVVDEKRRGTLDLILAYPLSPGEYLLGTFLGFTLALSAAVATGLGLSGVALRAWAGVNIAEYLILVGLALILGAAFLGLSFLLSIASRDHGRAVALSVLVWICAVFVFDLLLIGVLVVSGGRVPAALFGALLLLNPTDAFRILCFRWVGSVASPLGLSSVLPAAPSAALSAVALLVWGLAPLLLSYILFERRVANDTLV